MDYITPNFMYHSKMDTKHITGNIIHMIHSTKLEEIWELDYGPSFKVPLFRCKWFKLTGGGVKVDQQYGMTMVDFIPIYLVPLESRYSRRWCLGQHVQLIYNIIVIH